MTPVLGCLGLGLGLSFAATRRATPETRVSSVEIVDFNRTKWTFTHAIDFESMAVSKLVVGAAAGTAFADGGADWVSVDMSDIVKDETAYELQAGHGITSPGRTVPAPQSGSSINNKVLVTGVVRLSETEAAWTFDGDVTAAENAAELVVNGNAPSATSQLAPNVLLCTYLAVEVAHEWLIDTPPTTFAAASDRYVYHPQSGVIA